ncbi:UDP-4-amino-4,6-dideoxy-N-acetyl-beta-L-altrosamine transaminase [Desulfofundulus thermocisternus]|jgi:UDP-4-amino-4,6-dideoxy-N-acetyl-beta-L-altrosamine transaminase|uniref:UDP-4-amino-4, 6-dideoxy-N-acetyl-beta-L-altrosamine transaminase n=1 Tax=Desulfofundulus thermocisternus TaxID=42471 RepID=UPI00217F0755|nr:UDP-4-amino-4,6-dideoxy-N-acetyl-beta-L-altrosamine transaminase [Desulfofundulus thermocisternus]MCS5696665.1 UDP-4-amino-4,6-dideoxy-N-acetyl-beta-L-altrosamine transaminase [Desulfofundulus thermocisternus]
MKTHTDQPELQTPAIAGGRPVRETYLPYARHWLEEDDIEAVTRVLRGDWLTTGPVLAEFEKQFAARVGARYAVAFSSGTAALHAACFAAGVGRGDEVITSPITFVASANCALYLGAKPVFADIDPRTYNIDPAEIEKKITPQTKAIIPVHFTGQPCDLDAIHALAEKHNLVVIEDACHALGAEYKGQPVGCLSDMTVFSFHPVKHITTGEGGMVTTGSDELYHWLLLFRNHGITRDREFMVEDHGPWYYEMLDVGFNYRLTDIQAALGLSQLRKLDRFVERRREIARTYNEAFAELPGVEIPYQAPYGRSSWHLYVLALRLELLKYDRRQVFEALRAENIGVNVHYLPAYRHPYYRWLGDPDSCSLSGFYCLRAEEFYERAITLPLFPAMSDNDVQDVITAVRRVMAWARK